jgi:hypothetical protein
MTYHEMPKHISDAVLDEIDRITAALPSSKVFYSTDGDALVLAGDGNYIISVQPANPPFTHSAYLYAEEPQGDSNASIDDEAVIATPGWSTGWTRGFS